MLSKIIRLISIPMERRTLARIQEEHATAIIENVSYPLIDWNIKGILVAQYAGQYGVGSSLDVTLTIPVFSSEFKFSSSAKVVRRNKRSNQMAAVFTDLDTQIVNRLSYIARAKVWV